jgi:hypothetical protein
LAGVLGEAELDLESTELEQDEESSEKRELVPPPGGFRTLKSKEKVIKLQSYYDLGSAGNNKCD